MNALALEKLTMSSREIATLCEKKHRNVLRDIRKMFEGLKLDGLKFELIEKDALGREKITYQLPKDLTITLVAGYRVDLRHRIVQRWMELEEKENVNPLSLLEARVTALENGQAAILNALTGLTKAMDRLTASIQPLLTTEKEPIMASPLIPRENECFQDEHGNWKMDPDPEEKCFHSVHSWMVAYGCMNPEGGTIKSKFHQQFRMSAKNADIEIRRASPMGPNLYPAYLARSIMKMIGKKWIAEHNHYIRSMALGG